ncbi:NAD-dependent epimerase/dehydratase family protein [Streptomyces sp. NPDC089799]|uniref:NAD-dependent epimerase/dehydratase family protein n=1 Tax=Streptomyces sp. NPDC089799 TaxID=3155066 RepID=UPI00344397A9
MRILVLGRTGYLGAHVADRLRALPDVRVLDGGRSPGADFAVDLALDRPERLAKTLAAAAPDAVVNCAGATGNDPVALAEVNARGPAVLCAALREAAPEARLVHLGSAAEYGPGAPGSRVAESDPACPVSPYGASKLAGTVAVTASGLDAVVLRVGNPVGPGAPPTGLPGRITALLREAGQDPSAVLRLGDLSAYRDFVDVRDVARAVELAVTARGPLPPVLNVSTGEAVPARDLVRALVRRSGFRGRVEEQPAGPAGVSGAPGAAGAGGAAGAPGSSRSARVSWQCSDVTAAERALGWRPEHPLDHMADALWGAAPVDHGTGP